MIITKYGLKIPSPRVGDDLDWKDKYIINKIKESEKRIISFIEEKLNVYQKNNMVGCIGWFYNNEGDHETLSVLEEIDEKRDFFKFHAKNNGFYKYFRPAKLEEIRLYVGE